MTALVIRSSRPERFWEYLSPGALLATLARHGELIGNFAAREILERNKGAILGVAWNIINPLLTLLIYTLVFGYIFGSTWPQGNLPPRLNFPLTFFVGHTLFQVFAETANRAPSLVASRPNLVRKVVFPLEILPVTVVLASLVYAAITISICIAVLLIGGGQLHWSALLFPLMFVPLVLISLGVSWFMASLGVFLHDMRHIVGVLTQLVMFMTPVFYQEERIPPNLRWIINLNPLTAIVENGRRALLWDEPLEWGKLAMVTVFGVIVMQAGYAFFMATRRRMADVH